MGLRPIKGPLMQQQEQQLQRLGQSGAQLAANWQVEAAIFHLAREAQKWLKLGRKFGPAKEKQNNNNKAHQIAHGGRSGARGESARAKWAQIGLLFPFKGGKHAGCSPKTLSAR